MPRIDVVFFREDDGSVPVLDWLDDLTPRAKVKCRFKIERLRELGHELRRFEADCLRSEKRDSGRIPSDTPQRSFNMARKRKPTSDAVEILHRRYFEGKPEMLAMLDEERANAEVARRVHELRTRAGLTQQQLAKLVGTTASVICRLEDSDYAGHSLSMLQRIAAALDKRVEIRFVPAKRKLQPA